MLTVAKLVQFLFLFAKHVSLLEVRMDMNAQFAQQELMAH
jgi:hypothetical protein